MSRVDRKWNRGWLIRLTCVFTVLVGAVTVTAADAAFSDTSSVPATVATDQLAPPTALAVSQTCAPAPPVLFRAASSGVGQDLLSVAKPAGIQAGDVLVAQVANRGGFFTNLTAPAGWNLLGRTNSGGQVTEAVYYKVAGAVEPAGFTFRLVGASGVQMAGGIAAYSGVSNSRPVAASGVATGAGATAATPSVSTTEASAVVLHMFTKRQEDLPAPNRTNPLWQVNSGTAPDNEGATAADENFTGPGVTPSRSSSNQFASEWVAHTIVLRPDPGIPTLTGRWTASSSTWATGYVLERLVGGVVQAQGALTPVSVTSASDGPLTDGVTYTYRVTTYFRSWTSTPATATFTTAC
jgi:hypothetical protein